MTRDAVAPVGCDFDHHDPRIANDPYPVYNQLRQECPIARSDRHGGFWIATRYRDIEAIAQDIARFSSAKVVIPEHAFSSYAPPVSLDPPDHTTMRRLLLPAFAPPAVARLEPKVRAIANEVIDEFIERGECDIVSDYAAQLTVRVICELIGTSSSDAGTFFHAIHANTDPRAMEDSSALEAAGRLFSCVQDTIAARRELPRDDLISVLLEAELDGEPLDEMRLCILVGVLVAVGIDTTWNTLGSSLWHLARHPEDRARLRSEPDLMGGAVEEFLRAFAPVTMARVVTEDTEFGGCPMKAGDRVLLPFPAGNRDPDVFPDADRVVLDRAANRHHAFGVGIHRCIGAPLARLELRVGIEEFLRRIPEFHLPDPDAITWTTGPTRGPATLPVVLRPV